MNVAKGALHAFPMRGDSRLSSADQSRVDLRAAGIPVGIEAPDRRKALSSQIRTDILFHVQKLHTAPFH